MSDKTEFNFDITLNQPMSHQKPVELFAFADCKTYRLPERKLLIRNSHNGRSAVIMPEVLTALAQCTRFATLDEHIENVRKAIPQLREHPDQIRQVLASMARDGMIISAQTLCDAFNAVKVEDDPSADVPAVVAIITCDRPEALERLLNSIAEHGDPAGFEKLYVIDDSRQAESIERNRALVETFHGDSQIDSVYFGREQQSSLMNRMIERAPGDEAAIRFLIDFEHWRGEKSYGLARNYALLVSAGNRLVMLDDDTLFQVYEPHPRPKGVNFRDEIREAEFFDKVGDWPGLKLRPELDPVKAHLFCLGLPLRQAMGRLGVSVLRPEHLAGCTFGEVQRLTAESPVIVTECGSVGDPGVGNNSWIIELSGESRQKMLASDESVARAVANDNAWLGRKQPHVGARSNMSQIVGLDNRQNLPPYFPIERGEDRLFGAMLAILFPAASVLDYPWAAPHLPLESRATGGQATGFSGPKPFPAFFREWVGLNPPYEAGAGEDWRYQYLARLFGSLARMTSAQLQDLFEDESCQMASDALVRMHAEKQRLADKPGRWAEYLEEGIGQANGQLSRMLRKDAVAGGEEHSSDAAKWQGHWAGFADSLYAWKQMLDTVKGD